MRIRLLLAASLVFAPFCLLGSQTAEMQVSVRVIGRTVVSVDGQPASIELSPADVARGYVDVPSGLALRVRTNDRSGYVLRFEGLPSAFSKASVRWGANEVVLGNEERYLAQPYQQGGTSVSASVRLYLAPAASPGAYPWPVHISAGSY